MGLQLTGFFAFYLAVSLVDLAIAAVVYFHDRTARVNKVFVLFAVCWAAWIGTIGIAHDPALSSVIAVRLTFVFGGLLLIGLLTLVAVFPSSPIPRHHPYLLAVSVGFAFVASSFTPFMVRASSHGPSGLAVTYGPLHPFFGIYALAMLAASFWLLVARIKRSMGRIRLQLRYLLVGLLVPAIGIATTNIAIPLVFKVSRYGRYGPVFFLFFLVVTAHAIIRHRLLNVRLVVSRTIAHIAAAVVSGSLFVAVVFALHPLATRIGLSLPLNLAAIFVIALLFEPLTRAIRTALDRYLYRAPFDSQRTLREASGVISSMLDLHPLLEYVCELIMRTMRPEVMAVYLNEPDSDQFRLVVVNPAVDGSNHFPSRLTRISPLVTVLEEKLRPLGFEEPRSSNHTHVPAALNLLASFGGNYVHPISVERRLLGFAVLGAKRSGDPYFQEDIDLLSLILSQASVAVRNAQLYRQIQEVEAERRRTERLAAVGSLASGVAHEIKNPLVAIRTFAELLPDRFMDDEFRAHFSSVMVREIQRIDELLERLRGLAGPAQPKLQSLDLRAPIEEILTLLQGRLQQAHITVVRNYDSRVPSVVGDENQLKQFFLNVFMNALDAMPDGGTLTIRLLYRTGPARSAVVAEIHDTGCGIPEAVLGKIFEPFFTTKQQGSGLGLSICRGIADAHRATLRAHNNFAGRGAVFVIEFPAEDGASPISFVSSLS